MTQLRLIDNMPSFRSRIAPVTAAWHGLWKTMFDPYRPERHYMRGPGPKSLAKLESQVNS